MKVFQSMTIALVLGFAQSAAVPDVPSFGKRGDGFISLDFSVTTDNPKVHARSGIRRRGDYADTLYNKYSYYVTDIFVGSGQQKISVDIDTGSSDLWLVDSQSGVEGTYGTFDSSSSSTYQLVGPGFHIQYVDKSFATGNWVRDTVILNKNDGPKLTAQEFGDATVSTRQFGIMGVGKPRLEASVVVNHQTPYPNIPQSLKNQGFISKVAYSLYLSSKQAQTGTLLFGGIDNAKYTGKLVSLKISDDSYLAVTCKSVSTKGQSYNIGSSVVVDTGSTYTYLPDTVLGQLAASLNLDYDSAHNSYTWPSADAAVDVTIDFEGVSITIPSSELIGSTYDNNLQLISDKAFLIFPRDDLFILGDNFLRQAYVVFNLDDDTISFAPVKYTDSSSITVIN